MSQFPEHQQMEHKSTSRYDFTKPTIYYEYQCLVLMSRIPMLNFGIRSLNVPNHSPQHILTNPFLRPLKSPIRIIPIINIPIFIPFIITPVCITHMRINRILLKPPPTKEAPMNPTPLHCTNNMVTSTNLLCQNAATRTILKSQLWFHDFTTHLLTYPIVKFIRGSSSAYTLNIPSGIPALSAPGEDPLSFFLNCEF